MDNWAHAALRNRSLILVASALALVGACAWEAGAISTFAAILLIAVGIATTGYRGSTIAILVSVFVFGASISAAARSNFDASQWVVDGHVTRVAAEVRLLNTPVSGAYNMEAIAVTRDASLPVRIRIRLPNDRDWRAGQCIHTRLDVSSVVVRGGRGRESIDRLLGVGAIATARGRPALVPCDSFMAWVEDIRHRIRASLTSQLPVGAPRSVLLGLVLGERQEMQPSVTERLQRTGLAHLMAISGLHIGLAAGIGFWAFRWVPPPVWLMRQDIAWVGAVFVSGCYAVVSGFGMPAQRALLATLLVALAHWQRVGISGYRMLAIGAVLIVVLNPAVIESLSFWMSFSAVCLLSLHRWVRLGRWQQPSRVDDIVSAQVLLSSVMAAGTATVFGFFSTVSVLANLVFIPVFGFVIVPSLLVTALLVALGLPVDGLWAIPAWVVSGVLWTIDHLSENSWIALHVADSPPYVVATVIAAMLWAVLAARWPARLTASAGAALLFLARPAPPPQGCFDIRAHDVGHGLAVTVATSSTLLVFDAGPQWPGSDAGARVLVPWLQRRGVTRVDRAVQSHSDMDHAGGFVGLRAGVDVQRWLGTPESECVAGQRWQRDGVQFEVLWPTAMQEALSDNNRSCVMVVSSRSGGRALLPGDIEQAAERELIYLNVPAVGLVLVPHHGSITSSHRAFVAALSAKHAWVSNARRKGWRMPHPEVVAVWRSHGAKVFETADVGALSLRVCSQDDIAGGAKLW
ncbi:MAG: DNA internalization-related competence protein ComEC/Rec2 [Pseudomonadota bacterium]